MNQIECDVAFSGRLAALQNDLLIATCSDCAHLRVDVVIGLTNKSGHLHVGKRAIGTRLQTYVGASGQLAEPFLVITVGRLAIPSDPHQEYRDIWQ